ncbi:MAG: TIGR02710 family CRISPR-associated CARF protein [Nitrospirales bacterium]
MSGESPVKALLIAFSDDAPAAVYVINRLQPDLLCFFVPASAKPRIDQDIQPKLAKLPRRWDAVVTTDPQDFMASFQALARTLPDLLRTWEVQAGELIMDLTGATSAMAAAMMVGGMPFSSRVLMLGQAGSGTSGKSEPVMVEGRARVLMQGNPWDEADALGRREACEHFNRGAFTSAATLFKHLEARVSGGQKPLYHALADLAEGYALWERFQHRQAWDKLKTAGKALDMVSVWGGPPGLKGLVPTLKHNAGFLEKLVLDPQEVKEHLALDLLAHARRRAQHDQHYEAAMATLVRALEAFAQWQLFKGHRITSWDVRPDQLPQALRQTCETCYLDDVDGKFKLPLYAQFRALAGLGDPMGQIYLAQWAKMKPLFDAAGQAVLGHGFEPIKAERFTQLYGLVVKITNVPEDALPRFPVLTL